MIEDIAEWLEQVTANAEDRAAMMLAARILVNDHHYSYRKVALALDVSYEWVRRALMSQ